MQYGQFEKALIHVLGIDEAGLGAFRGRLRHLRTLGIPNVPKGGSGNAVHYKKEDLFTTLIALDLETLGFAPETSAIIANKAARQIDLLGEEDEVFLIVANVPKRTSSHDIPDARWTWLKNNFGRDTYACIVIGVATAGKIVTNMKTPACVVINLSER